MARVQYVDRTFRDTAAFIIYYADKICAEYAAQGYNLTLRQLYYQFVARDLFPGAWTWRWTGTRWVHDPTGTKNADPNYDKLGTIVNDARLAGYLDWNYIVDRTRNLESNPHWRDGSRAVRAVQQQFMVDRWADQPLYVEVWIEKDALIGVLEVACPELDVPYFSCRGYTSQSEMWAASQRLGKKVEEGKECRIVHLGDHDPSGIDMTRDIHERLAMFMAQDLGYYDVKTRQTEMWEYTDALGDMLIVDRVALNMDQIRQYQPPPNPAKLSDSRAREYIANYGRSSWELDALDVRTLAALVRDAVNGYTDEEAMEETLERENDERETLTQISARYSDVQTYLRQTDPTKKLITPPEVEGGEEEPE